MGKCGQKMTFSNFRAMNLSIVVGYIMGESFFRTSTNSTVFNRTRLELLVKIITVFVIGAGRHSKHKAMQT
jgi:hypothetical protein